jgi:hypothetical protein
MDHIFLAFSEYLNLNPEIISHLDNLVHHNIVHMNCAPKLRVGVILPRNQSLSGNVDTNEPVLALRLNSSGRHISGGSALWRGDGEGNSHHLCNGDHDL